MQSARMTQVPLELLVIEHLLSGQKKGVVAPLITALTAPMFLSQRIIFGALLGGRHNQCSIPTTCPKLLGSLGSGSRGLSLASNFRLARRLYFHHRTSLVIGNLLLPHATHFRLSSFAFICELFEY